MKYFLIVFMLVLFIGCSGEKDEKKTETGADSTMSLQDMTLKPEIVTKPAFAVVGMKYHGNNLQGEISELWDKFLPRMIEIENPVRNGVAYGIMDNYEAPDSSAGADADAIGAFDYLAGIEVTEKGAIPEGMDYWEVPEQKYAVFTFPFSKLIQTYNYALRVWLPKSGYVYGDGPEFEYYPPNFGSTEDSEMKYYIPIKEKK
jgi:predicted transcriptional regulator YdeE